MALLEKRDRCVALLEPEIESPAKRQRCEDAAARDVQIVSVSPSPEDHNALERCLARPWILRRAFHPEEGMELLRSRGRMPAVICERDLQGGAWKGMLGQLAALPNPPLLIVSSACPDAQLWAEALNLGAFDVLTKPFDDSEVGRTLHSAWIRWADRAASGTVAALPLGDSAA